MRLSTICEDAWGAPTIFHPDPVSAFLQWTPYRFNVDLYIRRQNTQDHSDRGFMNVGFTNFGRGKRAAPPPIEVVAPYIINQLKELAKEEAKMYRQFPLTSKHFSLKIGFDLRKHPQDAQLRSIVEDQANTIIGVLIPKMGQLGRPERTSNTTIIDYALPHDNEIDWRPTETIPDDYYSL